MNALHPFVIFALIFEVIAAIPLVWFFGVLLGFVFISLFGITLHVIIYNLAKERGLSIVAPVAGGFAGFVSIVPIVGTVAHLITFALYIRFFLRNKDAILHPNHLTKKLSVARNLADSSSAAQDELTMIEGIGDVTAKLLIDSGIDTFGALANLHPRDLSEFLAAHSLHGHDPSTWPEQAILARDGKWHDLKRWQDILDGGHRPDQSVSPESNI